MNSKERQFEALVQETQRSIYRICYSFVSEAEEVEDLRQEIYIAVWKSMDRFEAKSSWNTFIYRIALNTAITYYNRLKRRREDRFVEAAQVDRVAEPETEEAAEVQERLQRMHACIRRLKEEDRLVISLVLENLSYQEIAEVLDLTPSHVGVKIKRAKGRLLKLMNADGNA